MLEWLSASWWALLVGGIFGVWLCVQAERIADIRKSVKQTERTLNRLQELLSQKYRQG